MKTKNSLFITFLTLLLASSYVASTSSSEKKQVEKLTVATFSGGCFWCVESDFEKHPGIHKVISGFSGGSVENPSYKQVSKGGTGHVEAVQVYYDTEKLSYTDLLQIFWRQIDPTDDQGQFVDRGKHYRPVIFYHTADQKKFAEQSKQSLQSSARYDKPLTTEIVAFKNFYAAEEYHQDYYKKNPLRYKYYRYNSGRDQYLTKTWGADLKFTAYSKQKYLKPTDKIIRSKLTPLQYQVTQNDETERAFNNPYWNNKKAGIYVDIVSGEPLFSSLDKYKSGTGWPSFTQPIDTQYIVKKTDYLLIYPRTEIRSKLANSHLGHLFKDGPQPTGLRYCINSASLRFIPTTELQANGYGHYLDLFSASINK